MESLKVISHFDELVARRVGVPTLLHHAAMMSGVSAGASDGSIAGTCAASPGGPIKSVATVPSGSWPRHQVGGDGALWVWIERSGDEHANDAMVLERLALSIDITRQRSATRWRRRPLEILLDEESDRDQRLKAARALGLDPERRLVIVASPPGLSEEPTAINLETEHGRFRATLDPVEFPSRAGVGLPARAVDLPASWADAVTAFRMTTQFQPILFAEEIGPFLLLRQLSDTRGVLIQLRSAIGSAPWVAPMLDAIVASSSIRAAAALLHVHHSTLQARITELDRLLGFNVGKAEGRGRLQILLALHRLTAG